MGNETQLPLTLDFPPAELPLTELPHHFDAASHALHIPEDGLIHSKAMEPRCRRLGVWLAVLVALLVSLGLAYLAGSRAGNYDNHINWTHYFHNLTEAERLIHGENAASWKDTAALVVSLDCRPILTKVSVRELLSQKDERRDLKIFPSHLAVPRCNDTYAFCGNEQLGDVTGRCVPKVTRTEHFEVLLAESWNTSAVECEVHLECHCGPLPDPQNDTGTHGGDCGEGDGGSGDDDS